MADIRFDRLFRTPNSEGYSLMEGSRRLGRIDLHYTAATVYGTLVLEVDREEPEILKIDRRDRQRYCAFGRSPS